jgi:hypothetical protein
MQILSKMRQLKSFIAKSHANFALVSAGIVCLILLVVFGLKLAILDKADSIPAINLPDNAAKVNFDLNDLTKAETLANKQVDLTGLEIEAAKFKGYTLPQVEENYKTQMQKDGWTFTTQDDSGWFFFQKGNTSVALTFEAEDAAALDYAEKISPNLRQQLSVGDVLAVLVRGPYEKVRLLGE